MMEKLGRKAYVSGKRNVGVAEDAMPSQKAHTNQYIIFAQG